jgi:phosphoglycolate phosphatase
MKKYIAFDFDGTIVSSMALGVQLYNEIAEKYNYRKIQEEELHVIHKLSIPERLKMFNLPLYKIPKIIVEFKKNYNQHVGSLRAIEGMKQVIFRLKEEGYTLGIISSNSVPNIEKFLAKNQFDVFDQVYSSRGLFGKQSTINNVIKKLRIKKEDMIYIGDEVRDINACKKAGVKMIAVSWGFDSRELLEEQNPDYIADKPADITEIMQRPTSQI